MSRRVGGALFAGAALISAVTILRGIDPFDEGLALQAAHRITGGQLLYRDFSWAYGPAWPYLLAALRGLFGASLLHWRIVRVLVDAGVATTVFWLVVRETASRPLALVAWLLAACTMADPRSANPFAPALLCTLLAVALGMERRALAAGLLAGLAGAFRIDFAVYALAALLVALPLRRGQIARAAAGAALPLAIAYVPFLIAIGPADLYDALIGTSLRESSYWTLPFPLAWHGGIGGPHAWKDALDFYVPLLLVIGTAIAAVTTLLRPGRRREPAALLVLAAGFLLYLHSRTDEFHAQPLAVVLAILLPVAIGRVRASRPVVALSVAAAIVLALLVVQSAGDRISAVARPPATTALHLPVADGVRTTPGEARALELTVPLADELVPPGKPIYVLTKRSDLAPIGNPLLYVLVDRPNPTRRDFGLLTSAAGQRSVVAALERARPLAIIRWTDPLSVKPEPNRRGRPTGIHTLDDWVAAHYRLRQRAGYYDVLVPR